ncbi:hypothetical protein SAMN05421835_104165 [Amycolatopsis sacchari]|uniref:DUF4149 domain-containing protein n=1 Tax=Amycolatopsis sacchari TaxID=115433 RepID=A0A1I3Q3Q6_9PSEU|nr:hypothetical protein [Amycolatopsis sacchari]SFJ28335.1 hypothetical protein SAMN05421835_104165 [Amycolatopsis sacchari]
MTATAALAGVACLWLGMVLAISFLEAPLKFRAPDVTVRIGLGIGRLVFRALNAVEAALAVVVVVTLIAGHVPGPVLGTAVAAVGVLALQLVAIRPVLNRRSDRVLAGEDPPRSRAHLGYVGTEVVKVALLLAAGVLALSGL